MMNLSVLLLALNAEAPIEAPANVVELPPLFALSKRGQIRTYRIIIEHEADHSIVRTCKRVTDGGVWQEDVYEYWTGVNIGKSNETTFQEQAYNEALSMWNKLKDKGFTTTRPKKGARFNTDANGSMKPMLASGFRADRIQYPCIVQPKYDGVRCPMFLKDGEVQIVSRKGKPYSIPHLEEWALKHKHLLPLDGELYNHKELTFQEIVSAVKRESEITPLIKYVVYDKPIVTLNNKERLAMLEEDFSKIITGPVYLSKSEVCYNFDQVKACHDKFVKEGYEGIIIRNMSGMYEFGFRSNDLIKYKEFQDSEFKIVDVIEASGRDAGTAIFVCECDAGQFNVKPQGTRELRAEYFKNRRKLIGEMVTVKYQGLSDGGIPRFPSAISIRDYE